ncbi:MAG: cadherin repeat domain-containing protein, partial [Gammaproteobacteria bacterium]|nr:cadherin repeat domain-containing protein [Gammaproteobacteria bacterium]
ALAGLGLALSGGGDDDEPPLEVPTVSLDTDTGTEGDGITTTGVFSVGNLESNATWEFSLDGGSSWTAGQGDSFTITDDGSYSVAVRQTRDGSNFEVSAQLSITIDTVAPEISVDDLAEIDENSGVDQVVIAANPLAEEGVVYSLADGSDAALSINGDTGAVSLSTDPDHETQSSYSFTIVATDIAGNVSEQALTLGINDLDEISPSITSGAVAAAIDENSGAGQIVYTATSDDTDDTGAVGGSVTYSLADGSDDAVSINGETGAVSLSTNPNHEAQSAYTFTVVATDAAGNTDEQAVTLGINDLDEVAPSITSGATANAIDENSGAGQIIYTATSSDSADVSGGVTYSLADGSDDALSINGETGAVSLSTNPDNETQDSYGFTVVATDAAGNASDQAVTLGINDLDESAPVITSGATAVAIDENSGAGQIVYTATSDDSADVSGGVTYSLAASSDAALSIDTATGEVTLSTDPDFETQAQFSFTVVATDVAGNAGQQPVTLDINDLDEVPPVLLSIDSSVADQTVTLTYDEALSETAIPDIADFSVRENTSELTISTVAIVGDKVILSLDEAPPSGPLQVTYTGELIQDVAGNIGPQFTQIIVSDGYLRGVEIYADDNNDGIADPDELLEGVTSNAEGEIILEGDLASSNLIITSGVNVDTGAVNEFSLSAPA